MIAMMSFIAVLTYLFDVGRLVGPTFQTPLNKKRAGPICRLGGSPAWQR